MSTLRRLLVAALLGAFAGAAALVLFYGLKPGIDLEMDRPLPGVLEGVYPPERDAEGLTFVWTTGRAELRLAGIDRRSAWTATIRVRGARPDPATLPEVQVALDGVPVATRSATNRFEDLRVRIEPSATNDRGAVLTLGVSPTFVPGPTDPRPLGIVIDRIRVAPANDAVALPPRRALGSATITAGLFGAAFALIGLTLIVAVASATLVALAQAAGITHGLGPYLDYGGDIAWYGFAIALALGVTVPALEAGRHRRLRNTARFAAAWAAAVLYLKLVVLLHPDLPVGEALAEADRFAQALRGEVAAAAWSRGTWLPGGLSLWIVAAPWSPFTSTPGQLADLLRVLTATVHAAVGLLTYLMVVRMTGDRLAAAMTTGIYHLVPVAFESQGGGAMSHVFGQSLLLAALGGLVLGLASGRSRRNWWLTLVAAVLAVTAHPATGALTVMVLALTAALFACCGGPVLRRASRPAGLLAVLAAGVAGGLAVPSAAGLLPGGAPPDTSWTAPPGPAAAGHAPWAWLVEVLRDLFVHYGVALLGLAAVGAWWLWRRHQRDRLSLVLAAWTAGGLVVALAGVALGLRTATWLDVFPVLAIAGGLGAASLWRQGGRARGLAAALLAAVAVRGVWEWIRPLLAGT